MDASARRRSGWVALCLTSAARMVLGVFASLLLWAVVPIAAGLQPTVVMTGSMLPRLVPGDVVFSRAVPAGDLQLGQTLLYVDPDQPGHLRMHRWIDVAPDGRLITKGDANPAADSTPIDPSAVEGVASLRIPFVARPVVWAAEGRMLPIALTALALLLTVVAAGWFRAAEADDTSDDDAADDGSGDDDASAAPGAEPDTDVTAPAWPRRLARTGAALLVVGGIAGTYATGADAATAAFTRTTVAPSSAWNAATYFSCGGAARAQQARFAWPLGEASGSRAADVTGNNLNGTYTGGVTYRTPGPCAADGTTGVTLNGTSGAVTSSVGVDSAELTYQVWIKAPRGSRGGTVLSFTDPGFLGLFPSTGFAVGMNTAGGLTFAFNQNGALLTISAGTDLRDDGWHQVTAVAGGRGMALYVDGAQVASNYGVPVTTAGIGGTARVGYGVAASLGTSTWNYFTGSVAFATLWRTALPADSVAATFRAAAA